MGFYDEFSSERSIDDYLLTPKNSALIIIDYQPTQINSIASIKRELLVKNIVKVALTAKAYNLPVVLSTVNVKSGVNKPTIVPLKKVLADQVEYDRTQINAWEDEEFYEAVRATRRRKLVMCALWTEACLTFPSLDALNEGYAVYPVVDAVGGTSLTAHKAALWRVAQAGAVNISWVQLVCELQRDWNRKDTIADFRNLLFGQDSPITKNEHRTPIEGLTSSD